ncbi:MAG: DUF4293 domain-containing protein [Chitinophagaceae bacterium]
MIQRQQSLWLLLAAVASFLSFRFPFYTGNRLISNISTYDELDAGSNFFILVLTGFSVLLAGITIFLFKDRKTQFKLSIGGIALSVILLILYFIQIGKFEKGHFSLTAVIVFAIVAGYIMATRGIWKDEKLVKSLDKLR